MGFMSEDNSRELVTTTESPTETKNAENEWRTTIINSVLAGDNDLTEENAECVADVVLDVHGVEGLNYFESKKQNSIYS